MRTIKCNWHKRVFCDCGWNKEAKSLDLRRALSGYVVCPMCGVDVTANVFKMKTVRKVYKGSKLAHFFHSVMFWDMDYTYEEKQ